MASKSPVSATTTVPDAFSCSREVIAVFFGSGWDILAYNTDLQQAFNINVALNSEVRNETIFVGVPELYFSDLKIFSQPFQCPEKDLVAPGWIGEFENT